MQRQNEGIHTSIPKQLSNNKPALENIIDCLKTIQWIPKQLGSWQIKQNVIDSSNATDEEYTIYFVARGEKLNQVEKLLDKELKNIITNYCDDLLRVQDITTLNLDLSCCEHMMHSDTPPITRQSSAQSTSLNNQGMFNGEIYYKLSITPALHQVLELVSLLKKINSYNHYPFVSTRPELQATHQIVITSVSTDIYFADIQDSCFKNKPLEQCTVTELKLALDVLDICIYHHIPLSDHEIIRFKNLGLYGVIDCFRTLLNHKYPQNRTCGDLNALIESGDLATENGVLPSTALTQHAIHNGNVYFYEVNKADEKTPRCEPVGLLSLTSRANQGSPEPTQQMIYAYVMNELVKYYNNIKSKYNALLENTIQEDCANIANYFHSHGSDYLRIALASAPSEVIKHFITNETTLNILEQTYSDGKTVLHFAVENRDLNTVKMLVNLGANINKTNNQEMTPFHIAAYLGDMDIVSFFVENGADVKQHGSTAIFYATCTGSRSVVKYLLNNGAVITNPHATKALLGAACGGYLDIVRMLIENGKVDINCMTPQLKTPLFQAVNNNRLQTAQYLIKNGASLHIEGGCILHVAIEKKNLEMIELLLSHRADLLSVRMGKYQESALDIAVQGNQLPIVAQLVKHGANLNAHAKYNTVLIAAVQNHMGENHASSNFLPMIIFLLEKGADVNAVDISANKQSALHVAVLKNNFKLVKLLVKYGADIHLYDAHGDSPFSLAQSPYTAREITDYLLEQYRKSNTSQQKPGSH